MLDVKTGKVIAEQKLATQSTMRFSVLSTPAVLDLDGNGYADVVYVGDMGGNVWKWVIHPVGEDRANDGSSVRTQPSWKFMKFFQASTVAISGDTYYKNFFQPPAAAYLGGKLWLAFGSGERAAIGFLGIAGRDENNRFFGVNDPDPWGLAATAPAVVTEAGLTDITTTGTPVASGRGYFFKTGDAEKFVTQTVIFAGKVITASFTPSLLKAGDPGFDPCTQRGSGSLYVFDLSSGRGDFTDGSGNETRSTSIGSGLPTDPKVSVGVGGSDNKIVIQKSGTEIEIQDTVDVDLSRGVIYWREQH
jgi:type IV pilus assembly protein PilY1